jgi:hypothetical protein
LDRATVFSVVMVSKVMVSFSWLQALSRRMKAQ